MKKLLYTVLLITNVACGSDILSTLGLVGQGPNKFNVVVGTDKLHEDIAHLKTQLKLLLEEERRETTEIHLQTEKIKSKIASIEAKVGENQFTARLVVTLKSVSQILLNIRSARKEWVATLKAHIALLEDYEKETTVSVVYTEKKALYSFEELMAIGNQIAAQQDKLDHEQSRKKETQLDLKKFQEKVATAEKAYREKMREQVDFSKESKSADRFVRVKSELLDQEVELAKNEKELIEIRIKEKEAKLALIKDAISIEDRKFQSLKQKSDFIVRVSLRVDQEDVRQAENKLKKEKQKYLTTTDTYLQSIEELTFVEEKYKKELDLLGKSYGEPGKEIQNLSEWFSTTKNAEGYLILGEMGLKNDETLTVEREIDLFNAKTELEKAKYKEQELIVDMVLSWYKIKHQKFKTSDELFAEVKKYQLLIEELSRERSINDDKRATATNRLNLQNHALSNLKNHKETIKEKRKVIFAANDEKYTQVVDYFDKSQAVINKQIETTSGLIEAYSKVLISLNGSIKQVEAMIAELQRVSLWHRSRGAISQEGIRNILPDFMIFFGDLHILGVHAFQSGIDFSPLMPFPAESPFQVFLFFLKLFFVIGLFIALRRGLPQLSELFFTVGKDFKGVYIISRFTGFLASFAYEHLIGLFVWGIGFYLFVWHGLLELYPGMLFFLVSIPYLLYLSYDMVQGFIALNTANNYDILSESLQARFALISSFFLYATVVIICIRESFLLGGYVKSELPNILLALYSIIIRGLLITFIRKEDLLSLIPSKTVFGSWVWHIVDNYYYLLLSAFIILMILSDPHIGGYDNLMSYIFWGIVGSALVIRVLFFLYSFFRRTSVFLFFSSERELLRERFYLAKTLYSLIAIFLFILFVLLGIWLIAWFWGFVIPLSSLVEFFTQKSLSVGFSDGKHQQLSILDVLRTLSYIPLSFVVASFIDTFILHRIFGVLLVDPGVHNTVSTISYYFSVITVITVGLWQEGFGFLIAYYLAPLLLGMAWALRDVFNDFVAYFIILVQQPLKVGDYIKLDEETSGVVRRITPRSIVLRRQNSYSLIVPNSRIMTDVVLNWDYSRSFIAFPDIVVAIKYFEDPEFVRGLLLEAVNSVGNVLKNPNPIIRLDEFGPTGFVFLVRAFITSEKTLEQWDIASDVRFAIVKTLRANGLDLSFPVQIVHLMNEKSGIKKHALDEKPTS